MLTNIKNLFLIITFFFTFFFCLSPSYASSQKNVKEDDCQSEAQAIVTQTMGCYDSKAGYYDNKVYKIDMNSITFSSNQCMATCIAHDATHNPTSWNANCTWAFPLSSSNVVECDVLTP